MILYKKDKIYTKRKFSQKEIIEKKIFLGNHFGFCKSKNFSGPIQNSLVGIRGRVLIRKNLTTHRSFLKALLFLLRLLKTGGKLLVVETGETFLPSFSLLSFLSHIQCHSPFPPSKSLSTNYTKFIRKWEKTPPLRKEFAWGEEKWFGGTLTNWEEISKKIFQFATLLKEMGGAAPSLSSRYEKWMKGFPGFFSFQQVEKAELKRIWKMRKISSIQLRLGKRVDGILCLNPNEQKEVIAEARLLKIPVVAFADSNTNLFDVDFYLPQNLSSSPEVFIFLALLFQLGERLLEKKCKLRSKRG